MQRGVSQRKAYLHTNDPSTRKDGVYFDASEKTGKYDQPKKLSKTTVVTLNKLTISL